MSRYRSTAKGYVRPMAGWWQKNPFFVRYMAREVTAVIVAGYALVLLVGLYRLHQGEAAYNAWRAALTSPLSVLLHLGALALMAYHSFTWFKVMPKTMPNLPIAPQQVTAYGLAATAGVSLLVLWAVS